MRVCFQGDLMDIVIITSERRSGFVFERCPI